MLRHNLDKYELTPDDGGFILLGDLLRLEMMKNVTKDDIVRLISNSDVKRFLIQDDKIRASYGHSKGDVNTYATKLEDIPNPVSYKLRAPGPLFFIKRFDIKPRNRQHIIPISM